MIDFYVTPEIRDAFAEQMRAICPGARAVEYAHEPDMLGDGGDPSVTGLHRYLDRLTRQGDINPAIFVVDRETNSAHDPFDADQEKVRAWTGHIRDLMGAVEIRLAGVPAAASLMCMLPANASFASPTRWREAVRRQADLGLWDCGSAHHFQVFAADENPQGLWLTDEFDRCRAHLDRGHLPDWPVWCQWCPATKGTRTTPGVLHHQGVLAKCLEHTLRTSRVTPQIWWPGRDLAHPAVALMLREVADVVGRRSRAAPGDIAA
jgi:hypothetical protein